MIASQVCLSDQLLDQLLVQGNRTWSQFLALQRGYEASGVRLYYLDGIVEVLVPGQDHEIFSHILGCLLTLFLAQQGLEFIGMGSADQKRPGIAFAQPDQSYCIGKRKLIPDLSIEVVFTSGGVDKLSLYQVLGVPEVWIWQDGVLRLYHLRQEGYDRIQQSELEGLCNLDLALLQRCVLMAETDMGGAVRTFSAAISA